MTNVPLFIVGVYMSEPIKLSTLNMCTVVCQLYLNKAIFKRY